MIANDNVEEDDDADVKARQSAAIIASAEFRGRPDLIEIAVASNVILARGHREMLTLNKARLAGKTRAEQEFHQHQIDALMTRTGIEAQRFDAIFEAMNEPSREEFWRRVLPGNFGEREG